MINSPIFIVGCDRSGTTLLRLMLIQSSELHIPQESYFYSILQKPHDIYGDFTQPYQRWFFIRDLQTHQANRKTFTFSVFNLSVETAESVLAKSAPMSVADAISTLFMASAQQLNKKNWGDKTPSHILHISSLAETYPDAKFIHIIRDGRDVAVSLRKAGWVSNFFEAGNFWKKRVKAGQEAGKTLIPQRYCEVYYEKLVLEPHETLLNLCNWLGLDYTPQMLVYYQHSDSCIPQEYAHLFELIDKPVDPSRVYAWNRSLSPLEIADFESVAGDLLVELGYELSGVKVPVSVKVVRSLRNHLGPLSYKIRTLLKKI